MSLEDGTEALMSGHTKGQEEKSKTAFLGVPWGKHHVNQKIGLFDATDMEKCIAEIQRVEVEAKWHGTKPKSRNKICEEFGLSPSTVSKRMIGKVKLMGPGLGGARRGKVFNAGKFQAT